LGVPVLGHLPDGVPLDEGIKAGHKSLEHFIGVLEYTLKDRHHYHDVMEGKKKDTTILGKNTYVKMLEHMVENYDPKNRPLLSGGGHLNIMSLSTPQKSDGTPTIKNYTLQSDLSLLR
jgi:hypothetical protein